MTDAITKILQLIRKLPASEERLLFEALLGDNSCLRAILDEILTSDDEVSQDKNEKPAAKKHDIPLSTPRRKKFDISGRIWSRVSRCRTQAQRPPKFQTRHRLFNALVMIWEGRSVPEIQKALDPTNKSERWIPRLLSHYRLTDLADELVGDGISWRMQTS